MKKLIILIASLTLIGCTEELSQSVTEKSNNRIKVKERRIIEGYQYLILEIDSIEYLTQSPGGFVKLGK